MYVIYFGNVYYQTVLKGPVLDIDRVSEFTFLTFMDPCILNVFSIITSKMQRYTMYLFLRNSLHVSGGSSVHHQELKTVYTASGTC
jgi:hypothetical protein